VHAPRGHEKLHVSWALHVQPPPSQVLAGVDVPEAPEVPDVPEAPEVPPSALPLPIVKS
jgi:hypothetical protein